MRGLFRPAGWFVCNQINLHIKKVWTTLLADAGSGMLILWSVLQLANCHHLPSKNDFPCGGHGGKPGRIQKNVRLRVVDIFWDGGKNHNLLEKRISALTHALVAGAVGGRGGWVPLLLEAAVAHTATCFGSVVIDLSTNPAIISAESLEMLVRIAAGVWCSAFFLFCSVLEKGGEGGREGGPWNQISVNFWQKGPILFFSISTRLLMN